VKARQDQKDNLDRYSDVSLAASIEVFVCETCSDVSIVLFDGDDRPFAAAVMGPEKWVKVCEGILDECLKVTKGDALH